MKKWWKEVVVYQIYPRSFYDANGDGNGDIQGIIKKLDYIKQLGCKAIWISPFFASPMIDNGYDISDFYQINPIFGTMEDFEMLIQEAKLRNIAIINDAVFSHTSNQHQWFIESNKSKCNKYADYYIWRDKPINEKKLYSLFSSSPWTYSEKRNQYYFHIFAVEQPDLNWKNPHVRKEMAKILNFWLKKGVKGFRFDVIDNLGKNPDQGMMSGDKDLHLFIKELRHNSWRNNEILTVAEAWGATTQNALLYCGSTEQELAMLFQFEHIIVSNRISLLHQKPYDVKRIKEVLYKWQLVFQNDGWNSNFIQNHDLSRVVSAWGDVESYWYESATALATINHLLKGTPYIYQGEEIGMTNCYFQLDEFRDVQTIEKYKEFVIEKKKISHSEYLATQNAVGRDNARTPMQWDDSNNAGFTKNKEAWIKINPNYYKINVANQINDPQSIFCFYQKLVALRNNSKLKEVIIYGKFKIEVEHADEIFHFSRYLKHQSLSVLVNWSNKNIHLKKTVRIQEIILTNYKTNHSVITKLRPYETIVFI